LVGLFNPNPHMDVYNQQYSNNGYPMYSYSNIEERNPTMINNPVSYYPHMNNTMYHNSQAIDYNTSQIIDYNGQYIEYNRPSNNIPSNNIPSNNIPRLNSSYNPEYIPNPATNIYKPKPLQTNETKSSSKAGLWCHQCKKKNRNIIYCSKYNLGFCSKKYCKRCLEKHYNEVFDNIDKKNWICMFCRSVCLCASCRRKRGEVVPKRVMKNKRKAEEALEGDQERDVKRRKKNYEEPSSTSPSLPALDSTSSKLNVDIIKNKEIV